MELKELQGTIDRIEERLDTLETAYFAELQNVAKELNALKEAYLGGDGLYVVIDGKTHKLKREV